MPRLAFWFLCAVALRCGADEIRLSNGDRITCEIKALTGERLTVATPYAGELSIEWRHVESIATSGPIELMLRDGEAPLHGILQPLYGGGALLVGADGESAEIALREIALLNPKPYETGRGVHYSGRALVSAAYARGNVDSDQVHAEARKRRPAIIPPGSQAAITTASWTSTSSATCGARWSTTAPRTSTVGERQESSTACSSSSRRARLALRGGRIRLGVQAQFSPWGPRVELFHEQQGFWNLEDTGVVLLRSKSGLRLPSIG